MTTAVTRGQRVRRRYSEIFTLAREQLSRTGLRAELPRPLTTLYRARSTSCLVLALVLPGTLKGDGDWAIRGGFGVYNNWLTSGEHSGRIPRQPSGTGYPQHLLQAGQRPQQAPDFCSRHLRQAAVWIYFPDFSRCVTTLKEGGGANLNIGGIDPNVKSPKANVWSATVERKISNNFAASVGYSGSHSYNLVGSSNSTTNVSYGVNINVLNDDLILNNSTTT